MFSNHAIFYYFFFKKTINIYDHNYYLFKNLLNLPYPNKVMAWEKNLPSRLPV
jgi:hypothetical protein